MKFKEQFRNPYRIVFGTDGWRGLINHEINEETISVVAKAFSDYLYKRYEKDILVVIGYDGRYYSNKYAEKFAQVLSANKINVLLSSQIIPTPTLSYFVKYTEANAGVMITASHNPPNYSGIKFKGSYGGPFLTNETIEIEQYLYLKSYEYDSSRIEIVDMLTPYKEHIQKLINFDKIRLSRIVPLIDSMHGAGKKIIEEVLNENGIHAKTIGDIPLPNFNERIPEPIEKNLETLSNALKSKSREFSIGLATDGDADRVGVMLENGSYLSSQEVILYLVDYIVNERKLEGNIVKTSSVTDKIFIFENDQRKVFDVQVGFKYICEKMLTEKIAVGVEESGGFGFNIHIPERDGLLSSLLILEMLAHSNYEFISDFVSKKRQEFGLIFYKRIDYEITHPRSLQIIHSLSEKELTKISGFRVLRFSKFTGSHGDVNGLKYYLEGNRWLLIRASETEPLFRFYAEAKSLKEVEDLLKDGIEIIEKI